MTLLMLSISRNRKTNKQTNKTATKKTILMDCVNHKLYSKFLFHFLFFFFKSGFICIALVNQELTLYTRVASKSKISLPLPPNVWD